MKKNLVAMLFICIAACLISSQAFAALVEGTWNSTAGTYQTQLGTWTENFNGSSFPNYIGSTPIMNSTGGGSGGWSFTGATRTGSSYDSGFVSNGSGYYRDFVAEYSGGLLTWVFLDGNTYSSNLTTEQVHYRMNFSSTFTFLGMSNMSWNGEGLVNGNPNFKVIANATGSQTGMNATSHWGTLDFTQGTLVSTVPIPGAFLLLGSGLLGLIGIRRKLS